MGKIVFKDISFSYGKNVILKNFNLEVEDHAGPLPSGIEQAGYWRDLGGRYLPVQR